MPLKRAMTKSKSKRIWGWFLLDDLHDVSSIKYRINDALAQRGFSVRRVTVTWSTPTKPKGKRG